jgi:Polyketide cyclase / dehydrase and lipid transport
MRLEAAGTPLRVHSIWRAMATYRTSMRSTRPPTELFAYMARFSNADEWDPGVSGAEELTPGPPALGSTYRLRVTSLGRSVALEYRIIAFSDPRRVVLRAENHILRSTDVIEIEAGPGDGSTLTYEATLTLRGLLSPFSALLNRPFRKLGDRAADGLRAAVGSGPF